MTLPEKTAHLTWPKNLKEAMLSKNCNGIIILKKTDFGHFIAPVE